MSLLHADSFDHYTTLTQKWSTASGASIGAFGRFGTNGYRQTGNSNRLKKSGLPNSATMIMGVAFRTSGAPDDAGGNVLYVMSLLDSTSEQVVLRLGTDLLLRLYRGNSATLLATSAVALSLNVYYLIEMKALISDGSGTCVVKVDGVERINFSGDTKATANAYANAVQVGHNSSFGGSSSYDWDDIVVMDTAGSYMNDFIGDKRIAALFPTAEGATIQWTPSTGTDNSALVDETTPNDDTDYNSDVTPGNKDTYVMQNLPTTAVNVSAVVVNLYARKDDAGTREIAAIARSGSTEEVGATHALSTSYQYFQHAFYMDPATSPLVAWTSTAVDAMECGEKVIT